MSKSAGAFSRVSEAGPCRSEDRRDWEEGVCLERNMKSDRPRDRRKLS
jgi:hypothetical protein